MRTFIFIVTVFFAVFDGVAGVKSPNVLFIAIDDLRPELGCYGNSQIISPNIDQIASEGLTFMRAYCQMAVCGPSRLSIMTGTHLRTLGVYNMSGSNLIEWRDTRKGITSLPEQFRKHGYFAACFGKIYDYRLGQDKEHSWDLYHGGRTSHFLDPKHLAMEKQWKEDRRAGRNPSIRRPATEFWEAEDENYTDGWQTQEAIKFLKERNPEQPFFLALGFVKPHLPFVAPKKYWDLYDRSEIELPIFDEGPKGKSQYTFSKYNEIFDYEVQEPISKEQTMKLKHGYYACISYVDSLVGQIISVLKEENTLEDTIIVIWGDHGFKLGEYGKWAKHTNLENDTRVPLIIKIPGKEPVVTKTQSLVELIDVLPTVCEAAGIPVPMSAQGASLLPLFDNPSYQNKDIAVSLYPRGSEVMGYSIRSDQWRYTEWMSRTDGKIIEQELYELGDVGRIEGENSILLNPNVAADYSKRLRVFLKETPQWHGVSHY